MSRGMWSVRGRVGLRVEQLELRDTPAMVGAPDPSFGTGGTATLAFAGISRAAAVALQPDGKVVVAGTADSGGATDFALARFNPDGTPDLTFSNDGKLTFGLGGTDVAAAVAIQPDGKIVAAGYTNVGGSPNNFALIRVNADGSVDTTFDGDGFATVDFGADDRAAGVAVQPDGKIVVVGSTTAGTGDFAVARLNTDGSLDTTFSGDGKAFLDLGGLDAAAAVVLQPDGKIVIAGKSSFNGGDFAVVRLLPDATPDAAFGTTGAQTINFGGVDAATSLALQPDGRIVVAGTTSLGSGDFALARLLPAGGLDTTFNTTGTLVLPVGGIDAASGVAVQPDGKIVVVGTTDAGAGAGPMGVVAQLTVAGALDPTFSATGTVPFGTGTQVSAGGVALTPTGRVVAAGGAQVDAAGTASFVVTRLIGTVEAGRNLAVGGSLNGAGTVYAPAAGTSGYTTTPAATVSPFGNIAANVRTAVADVDGDGVQDTILVTGPGVPIRVAVVSGKDNSTLLVPAFDPFGGNFTGGGFVAAADIDNDGRAEIIVTPDEGGGPRVSIFSLLTTGFFTRANFLGIDDANFRGGARAAAGDINGDGVADLVVAAGFGGGPRVALFDGKTVLTDTRTKLTGDFFVFDVALRNGVFVAASDVNADGFADLIVGAGPGGAPRLLVASGKQLLADGAGAAIASPLSNFFVAGNSSDRGGVRVAAADVDGDARAEVVVGSGEGSPSLVRVYPGYALAAGTSEPATFQDINPFSATLANGVFVG